MPLQPALHFGMVVAQLSAIRWSALLAGVASSNRRGNLIHSWRRRPPLLTRTDELAIQRVQNCEAIPRILGENLALSAVSRFL
jgi:hypothetical protein